MRAKKAMKKFIYFMVCSVFLIGANFAQADVHFALNLGGAYINPSVEYSYSWTDKCICTTIYEDLWVDADLTGSSMFGGIFGVEVLAVPNVGFYANYSFYSKNQSGSVSFDIPGLFYLGDNAQATSSLDYKFEENILDIGMLYHILVNSIVSPYIGGGVSLISAKLETPDALVFRDTYKGSWYYWWGEECFSEDSHEVNITDVEVSKNSLSKTTFHVRVGINIAVTDKIGLFAEGKYILNAVAPLTIEMYAKACGKFDMGDVACVDNRRFNCTKSETFDMNLGGGITMIAGIRIVL